MFCPAAHVCDIVHRDLASGAVRLVGLNPDHLTDPHLQQQTAAVCKSFARQRAIDFCVSSGTWWKCFGKATHYIRLVAPVIGGGIDIVAKPQHLSFLSDA
jgi:hypothetical protein